MTDHPLTKTRAAELWDVHIPKRKTDYLSWRTFPEPSRRCFTEIIRAAYDAGREDALKPLDPLADLTTGTVIRDVTIVGAGEGGDGFILADARGPVVATVHGYHFLSFLTAFTNDERTIRYTRKGDTWTAENLETRND